VKFIGEIGRTNEVSAHFIEQPENLQGTAEQVIGIHPLALTGISLLSQRLPLVLSESAPIGQVIRVVETGASIQDHDGLDWIRKNGADVVENLLLQEDNIAEFIFKNNGIA
jgi:hypothetical protein